MLNCGAVANVCSTLQLSHDEKVRVLVLDSHRPVHLSNIHGPLLPSPPYIRPPRAHPTPFIRSSHEPPLLPLRIAADQSQVVVFDDGMLGNTDIPVGAWCCATLFCAFLFVRR